MEFIKEFCVRLYKIKATITNQKLLYFFKLLLFFVLHHSHCANAETHGTITASTNYVFRMYSKSNNKPVIQANLDYQHPIGFYAGCTVSNFDIGPSELDVLEEGFPNQSKIEVVPYTGWSHKVFEDWRIDLQYSHYAYDHLIYSKVADYDEFYAFLHYKDLLTAQVSYTDDFYGIPSSAFFYELTGRYPLTDLVQFSSTYGYAQTKKALGDDYQYWNIGLTGSYKFISLDLRYHEAVEVGLGDLAEAPVDHPNTLKGTIVFSLSIGF